MVSAGEEKQSRFDLKPVCGSFSVTSVPLGADWYLDGRWVGKTPGESGMLKTGVYKIKVKKINYPDWEMAIDIHPGKNESVVAALEEIATVSGNTVRDPVTGMEFVRVEKGCFQMGSPLDESGRGSDESPVHEVCIDGMWIGKYEVTQGQWEKVMGGNPSFFQKGDDYPVENVSWDDSQEFIRKLNLIHKGKAVYRLPTEAEWEYACRSGGKEEVYCGGREADPVAWHRGNSNETTYPVGRKKPNGIGLYDMSGNVWEWCSDWFDEKYYKNSPAQNPQGPMEGTFHILRGGCYGALTEVLNCSYRNFEVPENCVCSTGFRLGMVIES